MRWLEKMWFSGGVLIDVEYVEGEMCLMLVSSLFAISYLVDKLWIFPRSELICIHYCKALKVILIYRWIGFRVVQTVLKNCWTKAWLEK